MELMTTRAAAEHLGVSTRQVQRLVLEGALEHALWSAVTRESVERVAHSRAGHRARAWSAATAWAAIALLSDVHVDADTLGASQTSRLRTRLRTVSNQELVSLTRNRARVRYFSGHSAAVALVQREVVSSHSLERLGELSARTDSRADGYCSEAQASSIATKYHLSEGSTNASIALRVASVDLARVAAIADASNVLAALDLAGSLDSRERAAGLTILESALKAHR